MATSLSIANEYNNSKLNNVILATQDNFPDALSGSSIGIKYNAPIILVNKGDISKQKSYLDSTSINNLYITGGTGVVSDDDVNNLTK